MKIDECEKCGRAIFLAGPEHVCDPNEVILKALINLGIEKREAEEEVIAAADAFYDLAHATLPELRMVDQWKEVTKRMDLTVQALRKIRTRERELDQSTKQRGTNER